MAGAREGRKTAPLPPLAAALGTFGGFADGRGNKQEEMAAALAPLARRLRGKRPRRFYSMREVAAHFGVSLWTVVAVYRRLEREGLLARVRGNCTLVPGGPGVITRVTTRGVVAIVNWLPGFLHTPDQRFVVMELERRLWDRRFVSEIIFYREEEKGRPAFVRRILAHRPNYVIWLTPGPADENTMAWIGDAGVRVVAIADQPLRPALPKYTISRRRGWLAAMRCWRRHGVESVVIPVPCPATGRAPEELEELKEILRGLGMRHSLLIHDGRESPAAYLARLAAQPAGVVFIFDIWHAALCGRAQQEFARLLAERPVLNPWPLPADPAVFGDIRTDALVMPWPRIVARVVDDLASGRLFTMSGDVGYEAVWRRQVPAARLARLHAYESI